VKHTKYLFLGIQAQDHQRKGKSMDMASMDLLVAAELLGYMDKQSVLGILRSTNPLVALLLVL